MGVFLSYQEHLTANSFNWYTNRTHESNVIQRISKMRVSIIFQFPIAQLTAFLLFVWKTFDSSYKSGIGWTKVIDETDPLGMPSSSLLQCWFTAFRNSTPSSNGSWTDCCRKSQVFKFLCEVLLGEVQQLESSTLHLAREPLRQKQDINTHNDMVGGNPGLMGTHSPPVSTLSPALQQLPLHWPVVYSDGRPRRFRETKERKWCETKMIWICH